MTPKWNEVLGTLTRAVCVGYLRMCRLQRQQVMPCPLPSNIYSHRRSHFQHPSGDALLHHPERRNRVEADMVKFSKQFEGQLVPEWKEAFVDYWQLKKDLKRMQVLSNNQVPKNMTLQPPLGRRLLSSLRRFPLFDSIGHKEREIIQAFLSFFFLALFLSSLSARSAMHDIMRSSTSTHFFPSSHGNLRVFRIMFHEHEAPATLCLLLSSVSVIWQIYLKYIC